MPWCRCRYCGWPRRGGDLRVGERCSALAHLGQDIEDALSARRRRAAAARPASSAALRAGLMSVRATPPETLAVLVPKSASVFGEGHMGAHGGERVWGVFSDAAVAVAVAEVMGWGGRPRRTDRSRVGREPSCVRYQALIRERFASGNTVQSTNPSDRSLFRARDISFPGAADGSSHRSGWRGRAGFPTPGTTCPRRTGATAAASTRRVRTG